MQAGAVNTRTNPLDRDFLVLCGEGSPYEKFVVYVCLRVLAAGLNYGWTYIRKETNPLHSLGTDKA